MPNRAEGATQRGGVVHVSIYRKFDFEAAHRLPCVEPGHPCATLHGHSYEVTFFAGGSVDPAKGWFLDWGTLDPVVAEVRALLDHKTLNDVPGLANPTCENLAAWVWARLAPHVPGLSELHVKENPRGGVVLKG